MSKKFAYLRKEKLKEIEGRAVSQSELSGVLDIHKRTCSRLENEKGDPGEENPVRACYFLALYEIVEAGLDEVRKKYERWDTGKKRWVVKQEATGALLRSLIDRINLPEWKIADALGLTRQQLTRLKKGKSEARRVYCIALQYLVRHFGQPKETDAKHLDRLLKNSNRPRRSRLRRSS